MNSPFGWPGGKRALTSTLLSVLPKHEIYIEVFAGSAKLLFAKEPSSLEAMNDLNGDVTNFFRVCKHRAAELAERIELDCIHAERFRELKTSAKPGCEIERAQRFAYLTWYSFSSKGEHFGRGSAQSKRRKPSALSRVRDLLRATAARLDRVLIEQQDFCDILTRYDSRESFFYLDPPYVQFQPNGRYEPLPVERREKMFHILAKLKGKFLLSFDDHPEIRARAKEHGFRTRRVSVYYSITSNPLKRRQAPELLIANYALPSKSA